MALCGRTLFDAGSLLFVLPVSLVQVMGLALSFSFHVPFVYVPYFMSMFYIFSFFVKLSHAKQI